MLEYNDSRSTDRLNTYKDLCTIANELGHKELIYQFLSTHRQLMKYNNIKNAARGLKNIVL